MDDTALIVNHFDHVTVCVSDLEAAKRFFGLLGLKEDKSVVISEERFATYMGLDEIEADHVTLVLPGAASVAQCRCSADVHESADVELVERRQPRSPRIAVHIGSAWGSVASIIEQPASIAITTLATALLTICIDSCLSRSRRASVGACQWLDRSS
jgi:catechol 2,3-dioxygenase-like lactoylglutathione lyase family enzyme